MHRLPSWTLIAFISALIVLQVSMVMHFLLGEASEGAR